MSGSAKGALYSASSAGILNTVLLVMDVGEDLGTVGVQVASIGVATLAFEVSNDNITWYATTGYDPGSTAPVLASTVNAVGVRLVNVSGFKWFRIRISAWTSGTQTVHCIADTSPIQAGPVQAAVTGSVTVGAALPAGTNNIGKVDPGIPATPYSLNSAASTNGALIITGTSALHSFYATNTGAGAAYVKLYNKATAPTVGTDVPVMIIPIPAAVGGVPGVSPQINFGALGKRFALGLGIAITGGAADADTTAVAAGQVKVALTRHI
jgi:hypothetical protein